MTELQVGKAIQKLTYELGMMYDKETFQRINFFDSTIKDHRYEMAYQLGDQLITLAYDFRRHAVAMISRKSKKVIIS